jgi:serine/threonine protein kinase
MSIIQSMTDDVLSDFDTCPQCGAALPRGALFCGSCGERLDREQGVTGLLQDEQEISVRYRILSLIRRRPSINLYLALDSQPSARGRMVALRDLDLSSCDEQARLNVIEQAKREYDLLRRWQPPYVMRAIDLRYTHEHLYTVTGFAPRISAGASPESGENGEHGEEADAQQNWPRLTTLQDFLQSGQGLPSEKRALYIMNCLCVAVDRLHSQHIIIGDLDPSTVILNGTTADDQPGLVISWLPPGARAALSPKTPTSLLSYFIAPEALRDEADARSDIYSLGAIFYLLLTGMPPEESSLRHRSRLRVPHEINPRMSLHISESVMQALAVDPNERFQAIEAFTEALHNPRYRRPASQHETQDELSPEVETVRILPLSYKDLARWRSGRARKQAPVPVPVPSPVATAQSQTVAPVEGSHTSEPDAVDDAEVATLRINPGNLPRFYAPAVTANDMPAVPDSDANGHFVARHTAEKPAHKPEAEDWTWQAPSTPAPANMPEPLAPLPATPRSLKQRITAIWHAINPRNLVGTRFIASAPHPASASRTASAPDAAPASDSRAASSLQSASAPEAVPELKKSLDMHGWIEYIKQVVLGQQQHVVAAAAIIETPLRVLPDQLYTIRVHIMGRNQNESSTEKQQVSEGLSALVHGDAAMIEVRSVLQESYAYVVQMATVTVPAEGYVAEVSIPMQPLSSTPAGRRDRLHVFFLNEDRHPLYEKPFVLEIFVSHHVKRGSEGHHVLTIPV